VTILSSQGILGPRLSPLRRSTGASQQPVRRHTSMTEPPKVLSLAPPDPGVVCRPGCAACCIAPSISSPIPGMPAGKSAGVPCVQLAPDLSCRLFGSVERPPVCASLAPSREMCGFDRTQALGHLAELERLTAPA